MLELMLRPAFCVKNGRITKINQAASAYLLQEGNEIAPLIAIGSEEYQNYQDGCLYLTLSIGGQNTEAIVLTQDDQHLFILEHGPERAELQALALAAKELRNPLTGIMAASNHVLRGADDQQQALFNRRLYQMMRTISNMSDAIHYCQQEILPTEYVEICSFLEELLQKTAVFLQQIGIQLQYQLPNEAIYTLADNEKLERSVFNLLSNAAKHTAPGGTIRVELQKRSRLYLSVTDSGSGLSDSVKSSVFARYLRTPTLTDGPEGIGLGMVLVRATAALHGGTVLIDQPEAIGTRVTMTLAIRHQKNTQLRTPILRIDYAGERSHILQELSDVLPASCYCRDNLS